MVVIFLTFRALPNETYFITPDKKKREGMSRGGLPARSASYLVSGPRTSSPGSLES